MVRRIGAQVVLVADCLEEVVEGEAEEVEVVQPPKREEVVGVKEAAFLGLVRALRCQGREPPARRE